MSDHALFPLPTFQNKLSVTTNKNLLAFPIKKKSCDSNHIINSKNFLKHIQIISDESETHSCRNIFCQSKYKPSKLISLTLLLFEIISSEEKANETSICSLNTDPDLLNSKS